MFTTAIAIMFALLSALTVGSVQFGGNRMGGVALPAAGDVVQNFQNMPRGPIDMLFIHLTVTGKSDGAASTLTVKTGDSAGAEGGDDLDLLLNAAFSTIGIFWEPENLCGQMTPAQWRTILGNLNKRDFQGSFTNGAAVPAVGAGAATYHIDIPIPVSLRKYIFDGTMFTNGSERLRNGQVTFSVKSSTPTFALTSGAANFVVSSLAEEIKVHHGAGDEGDIGPTWRATRTLGFPTTHELPVASGGRLFLADVLPVATNTATLVTVEEYTNMTPRDFQTEYRASKLILGGYDVTARCTPYMYMPDDTRIDDFVHYSDKPIRYDIIGPSTIGLYDVIAVAPSGTAFQTVATSIGGGGEITQQNPSVPSLPVGSRLHPALAAIAPKRIKPGIASGAKLGSPAVAANRADSRKVGASTVKAKFFRRGR